MRRSIFFAVVAAFCLSSTLVVAGTPLQIHHMDVGQGDGAVMITPNGKVVLFDVGKDNNSITCDRPVAYLDGLGVTKIDAIFVSHYHSDHIGCIPAVLARFPLKSTAKVYDRGGTYDTTFFTDYKAAVKTKRKTATIGQNVLIDGVAISVVAVNGKSQSDDVATTNENDLSLAVLVSYGKYREEIGGDLSGENTSNYKDVESGVVGEVGPIDVYKVHHHCSAYSSNANWLSSTKPTIAIISTGIGNSYHHPAPSCLQRLRAQNIKTVYWTELGNGGTPKNGTDVIAGNILIQVPDGGNSFSVSTTTGTGTPPTYATLLSAPIAPLTQPPGLPKFAWSSKRDIYHLASCSVVGSISPANLVRGDTAPTGKTLHNCPTGGQ